jgi:hypothetical protein
MPLVENTAANLSPSNLAVVLRAIVQAFQERGDTTPVMVGEHYATNPQGLGSSPCVVLVPEPRGGRCKIEKPYETGRAGKQKHACDVIVRASETGDDIDRFANVYDLSDLVVATVARVCVGKWDPGEAVGDYPTPFGVDSGAGVQICWGFTFDRDIAMAPTVIAIRPEPPDTTTPKPYASNGETGSLSAINGSTTAQE